ncbi:unnamed protein product [Somion occarium]|uniref:Uncharacterized protein n=1 Tax=Somion occarium TaxID=3059160 RepID=A0ABP1EBJ8_9APHY
MTYMIRKKIMSITRTRFKGSQTRATAVQRIEVVIHHKCRQRRQCEAGANCTQVNNRGPVGPNHGCFLWGQRLKATFQGGYDHQRHRPFQEEMELPKGNRSEAQHTSNPTDSSLIISWRAKLTHSSSQIESLISTPWPTEDGNIEIHVVREEENPPSMRDSVPLLSSLRIATLAASSIFQQEKRR